jgi:hypothetical protein
MSVLNSSIRRPYFPKDKYPRVIDYNFKELVKSSSTDNVEDLIREFKRLKNELPLEILNLIYINGSTAKGIDPLEPKFEEIDKLNHDLDEIEAENDEQFLSEVKEHPHFRNGTFIRGLIYTLNIRTTYSDDYNEEGNTDFETEYAYFYMQQGRKREIEDFALFRALYQSRNKEDPFDKNVRQKIPDLFSGQLSKIPSGAPIKYATFGAETKLTNIDPPEDYVDRSDINAVLDYFNNTVDNTVLRKIPEESAIKKQVIDNSNTGSLSYLENNRQG